MLDEGRRRVTRLYKKNFRDKAVTTDVKGLQWDIVSAKPDLSALLKELGPLPLPLEPERPQLELNTTKQQPKSASSRKTGQKSSRRTGRGKESDRGEEEDDNWIIGRGSEVEAQSQVVEEEAP